MSILSTLKHDAREVKRLYKEALYANTSDAWRNYFSSFAKFEDTCEQYHFNSELFLTDKEFKKLDAAFSV